MKWKIVSDSGSTIRPADLTHQVPYQIVPLLINIGHQTILDDDKLNLSSMLKQIEAFQGPVSTACPSPDAYANAFEGADNVICFTLSANVSGSYNSAHIGAQLAKENNPNLNVHIFDSHSAGNEIDLLILKALSLAEDGVDFAEMVSQLDLYHQRTDTVFLLENIDNLVNNGRVNKLLGTMIGLLGIRLVGVRRPEGVIELGGKAKGEKRGIRALVDTMVAHGYQGGKIDISHAHNSSGAEKLREYLLTLYPHTCIKIREMSGLCAFYAERNGLIVGFEKVV